MEIGSLKSVKDDNMDFLCSSVLDIVQSFPLLSYCIVSPIYISPICNV